ncbi:MAG: histidinol-phosphate transaminase [Desulfobacteraceae bacterium]|nr:histidinol-phosphate transaminase [Desulfobacteraceae bacterium]
MFSIRLKQLTPYVPGEQPQDRRYIKLNTNENPYPPSPRMQTFLAAADMDLLRRYPDPRFTDLCSAIAKREGVRPDQVFAGNGSDEVLSFAFFAFFDGRNGPLLFPEHTYSFYPVYCDFYGIPFQRVPLKPDFTIDLKDYARIESSSGVIYPNPNAPTGILTPRPDIRGFLSSYATDRVVIIDEAYIEFGGESAVMLTAEFPNLLVVKTLSKTWALAGMRLGFAVGQPDLIQALYTVKDSFNSYPVNALTQKLGVLAMEDEVYYQETTQKIIRTRDSFARQLVRLGWKVMPSSANFLFAGKPGVSGKAVYDELKSRGILVRFFNVDGLTDFVRITIGTDRQMQRLTAELESMKP